MSRGGGGASDSTTSSTTSSRRTIPCGRLLLLVVLPELGHGGKVMAARGEDSIPERTAKVERLQHRIRIACVAVLVGRGEGDWVGSGK